MEAQTSFNIKQLISAKVNGNRFGGAFASIPRSCNNQGTIGDVSKVTSTSFANLRISGGSEESRLTTTTSSSSSSNAIVQSPIARMPSSSGSPLTVANDHDAPMYKTELCQAFLQQGSCQFGSSCFFAHGISDLRLAFIKPIRNMLSAPSSYPAPISTIGQAVGPVMGTTFTRLQRQDSGSSRSSDSSNGAVDIQAHERMLLQQQQQQQQQMVLQQQRGKNVKLMMQKQVSLERQLTEDKDTSADLTIYYKTNLCRAYSASGSCPYGPKCRFAHGYAELRSLPSTVQVENSPLYKTELCRMFSELGFCRYGVRCQFAHGSNELRRAQKDTLAKNNQCIKFFTDGACPYGVRCKYVHDENRPSSMDRPLLTRPASEPVWFVQELSQSDRPSLRPPRSVFDTAAESSSTTSSSSIQMSSETSQFGSLQNFISFQPRPEAQ